MTVRVHPGIPVGDDSDKQHSLFGLGGSLCCEGPYTTSINVKSISRSKLFSLSLLFLFHVLKRKRKSTKLVFVSLASSAQRAINEILLIYLDNIGSCMAANNSRAALSSTTILRT